MPGKSDPDQEPVLFTTLTGAEADAVIQMLDASDAEWITSGRGAEWWLPRVREEAAAIRAALATGRALDDKHLLTLATMIAAAAQTRDPSHVPGPLASVLKKCIAAQRRSNSANSAQE